MYPFPTQEEVKEIIQLAKREDLGDDDVTSDLRVVTKLLQKEYEANLALGDAGVLLDLHDAEIEEREVIKEELAMYMDQPQQYVQELLNATMWPDQPLGRVLDETLDRVMALPNLIHLFGAEATRNRSEARTS